MFRDEQRELDPEYAGTEHDDGAARADGAADAFGVGEVAERDHTVRERLWPAIEPVCRGRHRTTLVSSAGQSRRVSHVGASTGGEDETVVRQRLPGVEADDLTVPVESGHRGAELDAHTCGNSGGRVCHI